MGIPPRTDESPALVPFFLGDTTMADINRVTIIGRLTRDADITYTPGGMAIAKMSLAINRRVKSGDGWADESNYFDVQLFGKSAESLKPYLLKGKQVGVDGYLKQDRWEKDGQKFSKVTINANDIQLLTPKDKNQASGSDSGYDDSYGYN